MRNQAYWEGKLREAQQDLISAKAVLHTFPNHEDRLHPKRTWKRTWTMGRYFNREVRSWHRVQNRRVKALRQIKRIKKRMAYYQQQLDLRSETTRWDRMLKGAL